MKGMTLIEILIAMALAAIMSAFILLITRSQLIAYEQNDAVTRMQQNERAGVAYVETLLRRSCGGIANGVVRVAVYQPATSGLVDCLSFYDGARLNGGSFANNAPDSKPDAVEIIYGTTPMTAVSSANVINATAPTVDVASKSGFAIGDLVLFSNYNYAVLMKIQNITDGATSPQATFTFGSVSSVVAPDVSLTNGGNNVIMKAVVRSLYVEDGTNNANYKDMLMLDPDGMLSNAHANAQPLVDNLVDFQIAVGADDNTNGIIDAAEWRGDTAGELPLALGTWNTAGNLQPRWLRLSFIYKTTNGYQGKAPAIGPFEDRTVYPSTGSGQPRFRPVRVTVAPRVWNLVN